MNFRPALVSSDPARGRRARERRRAGPGCPGPEGRALAFLCREVPRWSRENHCFSCHNNGDAARALYTGDRIGLAISKEALADTTRWLAQPDRWEHNGGDGPFSDKRLARLQFSLALTAARRAGHVKDLQVVVRAAGRLSQDQAADGSWTFEGENEPGSPTAYGQFLATYLAREVLSSAEPAQFKPSIDRASRWLLDHDVSTVTDAAVMLMVTAPTLVGPRRSAPRSKRIVTAQGSIG